MTFFEKMDAAIPGAGETAARQYRSLSGNYKKEFHS